MREILFRGKRQSDGVWEYGFYYAKPILEKHFILTGENQWLVAKESVSQFTGIYDKNGSRIFEGDILEFRAGRSHIVRFEDGCFIFTGTGIPVRYADKFEVIGDIHDNPELLEEANA